MNAYLALKKFVKGRFFLGLAIIGLIFIIGGISALCHPSQATVETQAKILDISEDYNVATEQYDYEVALEYTDDQGLIHHVTTSSYSSSWSVGDYITIKYNPEDPEEFSYGNTQIIPYIALGVGIAALIASLVKFIIILKTPSQDMNDFNRTQKYQKEEDKENISHE